MSVPPVPLHALDHPAERPEELERMAARLDRPGMPRAAAATREFLEHQPTEELRALWRAVEKAGDRRSAPGIRDAYDRWEDR